MRPEREPRGPIHGVPFAAKDIMDTADLPTEYGSPIYKSNRPTADAACVALSRAAGGGLLGKTVTTEFASRFPLGPTTNPHNPQHTPGGSSSSFAARSADFIGAAGFSLRQSDRLAWTRQRSAAASATNRATAKLVHRA